MCDKNEKVLFPYRGSKVAAGRVYQPLAFGSTCPRDLMPGHMALDADARTQTNLDRVHKQKARQTHLRNVAAQRTQEVYDLMYKQRKGQQDRLAGVRMRKFHAASHALMEAEDQLRPPDKSGNIVEYGKMDRDLWALPELRDWFNKGGQDLPPHDAWNGGHTITLPRAATAAPAVLAPLQHSLPRPSSGPLMPAGITPGLRIHHSAHWSDREGILKATASAAPAAYQINRPWKDRPLEDEGFIPPVSAMEAAVTAKWNVGGQVKIREGTKQLAASMQAGHGIF